MINKADAKKELITIDKLKSFLIWREKEFIEKNEDVWLDTKDYQHSILEFTLKSGAPLIARINTDLMHWDNKASHPWIVTIEMKFNDDFNGMPKEATVQLLNEIEEKILIELLETDGYLYVGRETGNGTREIYFACKDFRKPSKVLFEIQKSYLGKIEIDYTIFKDKYWRSLDRFVV